MAPERLYKGGRWLADEGAGIEMNSQSNFFSVHSDDDNYTRMHQTGANDWGVEGVVAGNTIFQLGSTNKIAGFTFSNNTLSKTNNGVTSYMGILPIVSYPPSTYADGFAVYIDADNHIGMYHDTYYNVPRFKSILAGNVMVNLGGSENYIAGFKFTHQKLYSGGLAGSATAGIEINASSKYININKDATNYLKSWYTGASDWGIKGVISGATAFQFGDTNFIGGFTFDNTKLYSANIQLDDDGILIKNPTSSLTKAISFYANSTDLASSFYYDTTTHFTFETYNGKGMSLFSDGFLELIEMTGGNSITLSDTYGIELDFVSGNLRLNGLPSSSVGLPSKALYTYFDGTRKILCIV